MSIEDICVEGGSMVILLVSFLCFDTEIIKSIEFAEYITGSYDTTEF